MTHEPTVKRLVRLYRRTTPADHLAGLKWYAQERAWIEAQIDELAPHVPYRHGCTIYAALSPQTPWERNRELVRAVLRGDSYPGGVFQRSWERATAALTQGPLVLGGPKVLSFDCNLAGCECCVTLDVHMHRMSRWPLTAPYEPLAESFRAAARRVGMAPAPFQATLWLTFRPGRPTDPSDNA